MAEQNGPNTLLYGHICPGNRKILDMQKKKHIPSHLAREAFRGLNAMLYICMTDWPLLDIFSDDASNWEIIVDVKDGEILWS